MKLGVLAANLGPWSEPDRAVALVEAAEEAGLESVWTVEHVVVPRDYRSRNPYRSDGKMSVPDDTPMADPLLWLTFAAAYSSRLRLGTGVLIGPQRQAAILAKEIATLDVLSGGRAILGLGAGWLAEEFAACGVPFEERGRRLNELIPALRALWTEEEPTFRGNFFSFERALCRPRPVQAGGVPVVVGGFSTAAARRAGRLADGFFPAAGDPAHLPELLREMGHAAEEAGRDPDAIELTYAGRPEADVLSRCRDLGVDRLLIPPAAPDRDGLRAGFEKAFEAVA